MLYVCTMYRTPMNKLKFVIIIVFASLMMASGLRAQYRWHIIHPNQIDAFFYAFDHISCNGNNYSVTGARFNFSSTPDTFLVAHSSDAGVTWSYCFLNSRNHKVVYSFADIQQIDSLDAITVGYPGLIFYTKDGSGIVDSAMYGDASSAGAVGSVDQKYARCHFVNAAEGLVSANRGLVWTSDSGSLWNIVDSSLTKGFGEVHSYGHGMFRVILLQAGNPFYGMDILQMAITTKDYWATTDTSLFQYNGPLADTTVHHLFYFGGGDTLYSLSSPYDTGDHRPMTMGISSDLGAHWSTVDLPSNIEFQTTTTTSFDRDTIVMWGDQSGGLVAISTDRGKTWAADSIASPLRLSRNPFYRINSISIGTNGRIVAAIDIGGDSLGTGGGGSSVLAYLEPISSSVNTEAKSKEIFSLFPNPATNEIQITAANGAISILDPLGRSYEVKRNGNTIDVSALPPGVYFINDGHTRAKFVKE